MLRHSLLLFNLRFILMPKISKKTNVSSPETSKELMSQEEQMALLGIRYSDIKSSIKGLEAESKKVRVPLEDYLNKKGSKHEVVTHADVDVILKYTERVGKTVKADALDYLKSKGLDECVKVVEVVDEDAVIRMIAAGKISEDDVKNIFEAKVSKAFSVDVKRRFDI